VTCPSPTNSYAADALDGEAGLQNDERRRCLGRMRRYPNASFPSNLSGSSVQPT
jgi:hypothetical protein